MVHWFFLLLLGLSLPVAAQGTGVLAGRVTDAATGETLPGANVRIEGTRLGAAADIDGAYRILGVPVGTYSVTASFAGYQAQTVTDVRVRSGTTLEVHFQLSGTTLEAVEVVYERPLIQRDAIGAPRVVSSEPPGRSRPRPPASPPTTGLQGGVGAPSSFSAQGWRAAESPTTVDGVRVTPPDRRWGDREEYAAVDEAPFRRPESAPLSTFGVDVDRASYANVRRMLLSGMLPPPSAVRLEEFVNAFDYGLDGPAPQDAHPLRVETEVAPAPWAPSHRLLRVGLQARRVAFQDLPPVNLVFLLDVSGSMNSPDKLPLVQQAMTLLTRALRPEDRVSIVVYAGAAGLVLEPTSDRRRILDAIGRLQAGGSTAGGQGLALAYATARRTYDPAAVNRVLLVTDGDFNVGVSSQGELLRMVEAERQSGVLLSVFGVGAGNLRDATMELLANRGNGTYSYLDSIREAERVLVREAGATLVALAKDVKVQVEFNPAAVAAYRLLGYENRALAAEEFLDDRRDAGEMGAGHTVTALYEIIPAGLPVPGADTARVGLVEPLRYQHTTTTSASASAEWATVRVRYKPPTGGGEFASESVALDVAVVGGTTEPSESLRWASAVAEAALVLRQSAHAPAASLEAARTRAVAARGADPDGDRAEFIRLLETASALQRTQAAVLSQTQERD